MNRVYGLSLLGMAHESQQRCVPAGTGQHRKREYKGIAFFNVASKYRAAHIKSIEIKLSVSKNLLLGVWLHNTGEDASKFETRFEFDTSNNDQTVSIPVSISNEDVLFDQIRITETSGTLCSSDKLPQVHIKYVALDGDSELLGTKRRSNNGVLVPDDNGANNDDDSDNTSGSQRISGLFLPIILSAAAVSLI
jgi:hypothetical protein